ncbi:hypothetical protein PTKIN_Ptkin09bG0084300 [Pterospermum kingtungense]
MENLNGKKRPTLNLKLFNSLSESFSNPNPTKSPRNFQDGVVGLGILAAIADSTHGCQAICFSPSPRPTAPISIVSSAKPAANFGGGGGLNSENFDELSEDYTCVISHLGDNLTKKHVHFGDDKKSCSVFTASPRKNHMGPFKSEFWSDDFLTSCQLCKRELHGLDIFMYRKLDFLFYCLLRGHILA